MSTKIFRSYAQHDIHGDLTTGDVIAFLQSKPAGTAAIVFLDPPFNLGKDYGNGKSNDRIPQAQYIQWLLSILKESERLLQPGGALYLYQLPSVATQIVGALNKTLQFRHWIAVSMKNTFVRGKHLYPAHYALLYYTKGNPAHFNRPRLAPRTCRKCGAYIKDYGGYKHVIDAKGVNLSDIWDDISPVRHSTTKSRGANELPTLLMERIIAISGAPGGLYVDPFVGGGNGVLSAIAGGMHFSACDISNDYISLVADRIEQIIDERKTHHEGLR